MKRDELLFIDTRTKRRLMPGRSGGAERWLTRPLRDAGAARVNNTFALIILMLPNCPAFHYRQESYRDFNYHSSNSREEILFDFGWRVFNALKNNAW